MPTTTTATIERSKGGQMRAAKGKKMNREQSMAHHTNKAH